MKVCWNFVRCPMCCNSSHENLTIYNIIAVVLTHACSCCNVNLNIESWCATLESGTSGVSPSGTRYGNGGHTWRRQAWWKSCTPTKLHYNKIWISTLKSPSNHNVVVEVVSERELWRKCIIARRRDKKRNVTRKRCRNLTGKFSYGR